MARDAQQDEKVGPDVDDVRRVELTFDPDGQAFSCELVDDVQHAIFASVDRLFVEAAFISRPDRRMISRAPRRARPERKRLSQASAGRGATIGASTGRWSRVLGASAPKLTVTAPQRRNGGFRCGGKPAPSAAQRGERSPRKDARGANPRGRRPETARASARSRFSLREIARAESRTRGKS